MEASSLAYNMGEGDIAGALGGAGCPAKIYGSGLPECSMILSGRGVLTLQINIRFLRL